MKHTIKINENELRNVISDVILSEGWFGRNFMGATTRGNVQVSDAQAKIQKATQCFASGDANTTERGFTLLGDVANYLMRAKSNGIQDNILQPAVQEFLKAIQTASTTVTNSLGGQQQQQPQQQQQQNGQYAQDWPTAEKEINQVVNGNFNNWPAQVKKAGWPDDKIAAYRKLANANANKQKSMVNPQNKQPYNNNPVIQQGQYFPNQQPQLQQTQPQGTVNPQNTQPYGNNPVIQQGQYLPNQQPQVSEAIDRIMDKYLNS